MRTLLLTIAALALLPAATAHAGTIDCGSNTGSGWNVDIAGAGTFDVMATNVGCRAARRVATKSYPGYETDRWTYRGWRCRETKDGYEYGKYRCTRGDQRVVWESGA